MSEENAKTNEGGLGGMVSAALLVFGLVCAMLCLCRNPQLIYAGHEAICVEPGGTVVVRMEYIYEDGTSNPERTSMASAGEESPMGYAIVSVEKKTPDSYSVALLVKGEDSPRVFDNVPACGAELP